jgi:hypothetical protein
MRLSVSIGTSVAVASVVTHGLVDSAMYFDSSLRSTYEEFFRALVVVTERLWSYAHGWPSLSHVRDFGGFFAPLVQVSCPVIGFFLFWVLSRHDVGRRWWKPLAIAALLASVRGFLPVTSPWVEATATAAAVLLMVWSVGGFGMAPASHYDLPRRR